MMTSLEANRIVLWPELNFYDFVDHMMLRVRVFSKRRYIEKHFFLLTPRGLRLEGRPTKDGNVGNRFFFFKKEKRSTRKMYHSEIFCESV